MKIIGSLLLALTAAVTAHSRAVILEESARISSPDESYESLGSAVGLDGDDAFATLYRVDYGDPLDPEKEYDDVATIAVWLFRKFGDTWTPVRKITEVQNVYYLWPFDMNVKNGIAAFALNPLQIFEKRAGDWVQAPLDYTGLDGPGDSVSVDGLRVLIGATSGPFQGSLLERDAAGTWRFVTNLQCEYRGGDDEFRGRDVGLSGNRAVVFSPYADEPSGFATPNVAVFRDAGPGTGWQRARPRSPAAAAVTAGSARSRATAAIRTTTTPRCAVAARCHWAPGTPCVSKPSDRGCGCMSTAHWQSKPPTPLSPAALPAW